MPRGEHPNSRKNLKRLTSEEAREQGRAGAKKSVETRRRLKTFQELDAEHTTDEERNEMLKSLKEMAKNGSTRAWELYAFYMGMKPADKVQITAVTGEAVDGLKDAIEKRRGNA